jgi:clan AA aspartic protease (TIGR02281 family)
MVLVRIGFAALVIATASPALAQTAAPPAATLNATDRFGLDLPLWISDKVAIARSLDDLTREPCDKAAIAELSQALQKNGRRRDAANALEIFSDDCKGDATSLRSAVNVLLTLSDTTKAEAVATKLIALEPYGDNGYYLRALARIEARQYERAIDDLITALDFFGNKDRISSTPYLKLSKSYEQLGRFCDAILPIEALVAIDPQRHDTSQTQAIIATLTARGNCQRGQGKEEVIALAGKPNTVRVQVAINGVKGNFILDTGATFVTVTRGFADKAKIEIEPGSMIQMATANGYVTAERGRAGTVGLKSLTARQVPAVVLQANAKGFGPGIDGLLGMSFLTQFTMTMDARSLRLKRRS